MVLWHLRFQQLTNNFPSNPVSVLHLDFALPWPIKSSAEHDSTFSLVLMAPHYPQADGCLVGLPQQLFAQAMVYQLTSDLGFLLDLKPDVPVQTYHMGIHKSKGGNDRPSSCFASHSWLKHGFALCLNQTTGIPTIAGERVEYNFPKASPRGRSAKALQLLKTSALCTGLYMGMSKWILASLLFPQCKLPPLPTHSV